MDSNTRLHKGYSVCEVDHFTQVFTWLWLWLLHYPPLPPIKTPLSSTLTCIGSAATVSVCVTKNTELPKHLKQVGATLLSPLRHWHSWHLGGELDTATRSPRTLKNFPDCIWNMRVVNFPVLECAEGKDSSGHELLGQCTTGNGNFVLPADSLVTAWHASSYCCPSDCMSQTGLYLY